MWIYENDNKLLYFISDNYNYKANVAIFSLCNTLVHGNIDKDKNKFMQLQQNVADTLQTIHTHCSLVIIESGYKLSQQSVKDTMHYLFAALDNETHKIPFIALFALQRNKYQKPYTHIFTKLQHLYACANASVNTQRSVVIGANAGRFATATHACDSSDSDRAFASNIDVCFRTPEQFFSSDMAPRQWNWHYDTNALTQIVAEPPLDTLVYNAVIFICGPPTSGKTLLSYRIKTHLQSANVYDINNYTSSAQMLAAIQTQDTCIIVDTCETHAKRDAYFALFAECDITYIEMQTPRKTCEFLNMFRLQISKNMHTLFTKQVYNNYYKNYKPLLLQKNITYIAYPLSIRTRKEIFFHF